ncbi:MAG: hypothetical protein HLUCCO07_05580 [Rhodobacteraceae bacterium HLUCCO07]|nr:MAG: hypothetical protein HLUCCO07_05580 [Rhodobacteraceae bacterium HLUCCO07]
MAGISEMQSLHGDRGLAISGHSTSGVIGWIGGGALLIAAVGLWFWPGAIWDPLLMLVKLGLSLFLACGGLMFVMAACRPVNPEVWLDGRRRCLRLIRREAGVVVREVEISYDNLSDVDFRDGMLIARDHHGRTLVEMPVERAANTDAIRAELGAAFARPA